jgi:CRP-like cAMP-binding protein
VEKPSFNVNPRTGAHNVDTNGSNPILPCQGHLKKLFDCSTLRVVPPQHLIYSQGESPHTICLICSGLAKLTRTESDGNRVIVGMRQKGWMLGAVSLFLDSPYETTAETITRSKLCIVPADRFKKAMDTDADFSRWVAIILSEALRSSILSIGEQSCLSGRQRLEKFLWKLVQAQNGADQKRQIKIQMILRNWEVAQLLALTPQHLCRLVKQLEKEGILVRKNGWLIVLEPTRLLSPEMTTRDLS